MFHCPSTPAPSHAGFIATMCLLLMSASMVAAEGTAISLGQDVMPGWVVSAQQTGTWSAGNTVGVLITVRDDAGGAASAQPISLRSGAPGLEQESWGPAVTGTAGTMIVYTVDAAAAAHTAIYVTLEDGAGNTMTSRFTLLR